MRKFIFRFAALMKYREHQRDRCQEILGQLMTEDRRLAEESQSREDLRAEILEEVKQTTSEGRIDPRFIAARRYYAGQLLIEKNQFDQQRLKIAAAIKQARTMLAEAEAKVKALDRLKEDQHNEHLQLAYKVADQEMEEAWMAGKLASLSREHES